MRRLILGLLMLVGVIGATGYARAQDQNAAMDTALDAILDQAIADMMREGPKLDNWQIVGTDIVAAMNKAEGGISNNVLLTQDTETGNSLTFFDAGLSDLAIPAGWTVVKEKAGSPPPVAAGQRRSVFLSPLDGPLLVVSESQLTANGTAYCGTGLGHYRIYRVPGRPDGELPEKSSLQMFDKLERAMDGKITCEIYEPVGTGYRTRPVTGEGHTMPQLETDSTDVTLIVRRAPIEQLLFPPEAN